MQKYIFLIFFSLLMQFMHGQTTFSKIYHNDPYTNLGGAIAVNDTSFFITGRGQTTLGGFPYAIMFFLRTDYEGNQQAVNYVIGDSANVYRESFVGGLEFIDDTALSVSGRFYQYDTLFYFNEESNGLLYKFDLNGDTIFVNRYIGDGRAQFASLIYDSNNETIYLSGSTLDTVEFDEAAYLVATDINGNILWDDKQSILGKYEFGGFLSLFDNGNIISAGGIYDDDIVRNGKFYKTTPSGAAYFSKEIGTEGDDSEIEVKVAKNQKSLIVRQYIDTVINAGDDPYVTYIGKMDTSGNFIWRTFLNNIYYKYLYTLRTFEDGSIVAVGFTMLDETFATYGYIIKLDSNGTVLWERTHAVGDSVGQYLYDFQQLGDKGYVISGYGVDEYEGEMLGGCWLLRLDSMGCLVPGCSDVPIIDFTPETRDNILTIFPNPVAETTVAQITIPQNFIIEPNQNLTLTIFDINGKVVDEYSNISVNNHGEVIRFYLHIKNLAKGIYPSVLTYGNAFLDEMKIIVQ